MSRTARNEAFFGEDGQRRIAETRVAIVGVGGLGSHVAQQLAYLGTREFSLIDPDHIETTNLNRLIGAIPGDEGERKVDVVRRMIVSIRPGAEVEVIGERLQHEAAGSAIRGAAVVFGCLDRDGHRLDLLTRCAEVGNVLYDLGTQIYPDATETVYGGRMVRCGGDGCLICMDELDQNEIRVDRMDDAALDHHVDLYGLAVDPTTGSGPSVVSINGVVASLAVTEFMVETVGIRDAKRCLTYRADSGTVRGRSDTPPACFYCDRWGQTEGN